MQLARTDMYQRLGRILTAISCIILMMPQGWCCWLVPVSCCAMAEVKPCCPETVQPKSCCCCQTETQDDDTPISPPLKCAKCIHDTTKPAFSLSFDFDLPLIGTLAADDATTIGTLLSGHTAHLHGVSPPLHVQLCVWRC